LHYSNVTTAIVIDVWHTLIIALTPALAKNIILQTPTGLICITVGETHELITMKINPSNPEGVEQR